MRAASWQAVRPQFGQPAVAPAIEGDAVHFASMEPVRIGMPALCRAGLSENWLWKECGHRHWLALAHAHGQGTTDFRNAQGQRLYPAFTSVTMENARLDRVVEEDRLSFALRLSRIGRTRFRSQIAVRAAGAPVATVTMESAFICRAVAGSNRSAHRSLVARPCHLLPPAVAQRPSDGPTLEGFDRLSRPTLPDILLDPSPHEDFNGADFLYFTAFQAMIDRAEWQWLRCVDPLRVTADRQIVYRGNIELGDRVVASLCGLSEGEGACSHRIDLRRQSDGCLIGTALSRRVPRLRLR